jgi:hypothetical protein
MQGEYYVDLEEALDPLSIEIVTVSPYYRFFSREHPYRFADFDPVNGRKGNNIQGGVNDDRMR